MDITIPITEVRTNIASIIKKLRENPELVYKITNRKEIVAELRAPAMVDKRGSTAEKILKFMKTLPEPDPSEMKNVSENIDDYLYSPPLE